MDRRDCQRTLFPSGPVGRSAESPMATGASFDLGRARRIRRPLLTFMPGTVTTWGPLAIALKELSFKRGTDVARPFASNSMTRFRASPIEHVDRAVPGSLTSRFAQRLPIDARLNPGAVVYLDFPIRASECASAYRFFSPSTILDAFSRCGSHHAAVDDAGRFQAGVPLSTFDDAEDSCALLELTKE